VSAEELAQTFEESEHAPVDLSDYAFEDWLALGLFWGMTLAVFVQFFTRYVLNDSFAWTEEIATNLNVALVFVGAAMCVRMSRHIQVDFLYRYLLQPLILDRGLHVVDIPAGLAPDDAVRIPVMGDLFHHVWP
jgi:hypothetical protein